MSIEGNEILTPIEVGVERTSGVSLRPAMLALSAMLLSACGDTHKHFHTHTYGDQTVDTGFSEDGGADSDPDLDEDEDTDVDDEVFEHDATTPWIDNGLGVDYGTAIQYADGTPFQFSGATFDEDNLFYPDDDAWLYLVGNEGRIARMNLDGRNVTIWNVAGDLEAIAMDKVTKEILVLDESTQTVFTFDPDTGERRERCGFSDLLVDGGWGPEGMAVVPEEGRPWWWDVSGSALLVATQASSDVGVYDLDACVEGASLERVGSIQTSDDDVAGLDYLAATGCVFVVHDGPNTLDYVCLEDLNDPTNETGDLVRTDTFPTGYHTEEEGAAAVDMVCTADGKCEITLGVAYDDGGFYFLKAYPLAMKPSDLVDYGWTY